MKVIGHFEIIVIQNMQKKSPANPPVIIDMHDKRQISLETWMSAVVYLTSQTA